MTKVNFILSSVSSRFLFFPVKHTLMYENFEPNTLGKTEFIGEFSNNWPNDLLETNVYKTLNLVDNHCQQY